MKYVHLENNEVTDVARVDPFSIFYPAYASTFIEAPDEVDFFWRYENGEWIAPPPPDYAAINKSQAEQLLQATDWTATLDIGNSEYSNPYLVNQTEFLSYRSQVRQIAVSPPSEPAVFPDKPKEVWSTESL
jgi:hypothetical protein